MREIEDRDRTTGEIIQSLRDDVDRCHKALLDEIDAGEVLNELHRTVTETVMSTTLARRAAVKAYDLGAPVDQIVTAYLDRALAAHEYDWDTYSR